MSQKQELTLSDDKVIEISLLPLRAYGDLLVAIQSVFKEAIGSFDELDTEQLIAMLPEFIRDHMNEVGQIIEIGTRGQITAKEALDERGLGDAVAIVTTIIEVNDVEGMVAQVKKAAAVFRKRKATQPQTQPAVAPSTMPAL